SSTATSNSSSSSSSSNPNLTHNHHHNHNLSISSLSSSFTSLSVSVSDTDLQTHSRIQSPSTSSDPHHQPRSPSSVIPTATSLYPTTLTSFDPDAEDGGKLNDPRKIIQDIQTAMNGTPILDGKSKDPITHSVTLRSRSASSTSIRPIQMRRPRHSEDHQPIRSHNSILDQSSLLLLVPNQSNITNSNQTTPTNSPNQTTNPLNSLNQRLQDSSSSGPLSESRSNSVPSRSDSQCSDSVEVEIEFEPKDLEVLNSLGEGAGGEVKKVVHRPSGLYMAKKTIPTSPNPSVHRQILRELAFNREVANGETPWITKYYGAFLEDNDAQIAILMEYCEGGSLDAIYKRVKSRKGRLGEKILGKVAHSVLEGLAYLHTRKIIHRDIKPSNILVTKDGLIKLCDLGVSGELVGSLAGTFMGTSAYMAPERIRGEKYSITSDVWSLGLTLLELALNRFPLGSQNEDGSTVALHPFELLQTVVTFEMPSMNDEVSIGIKWTKGLQNFLATCLDKNPNVRPTPRTLLDHHPWILKSKTWNPDVKKWLKDVWNW
ncbi:STE protein kinase, partial [Phakopsora pachyrhizi]